MKRPIKFRGRDKNGKFRYGDFNDIDLGTIFADVDEDSIAQLVEFDANGNEIYEGDVLIDELEQEYTAEIYDRPEKIRSLKLKEAQP